ncbi:MAG: hypothetical protein V1779_06110 [bacterium]
MNNKIKYLGIIFIIVVAVFVFLECGSNKNDIVLIRNHIRDCTTDLIQSQLSEKIRTKEYEFVGQTFIMSIDTLGKPCFLRDGEYTESIDIKYDDENFSVSLINGIITVDQE